MMLILLGLGILVVIASTCTKYSPRNGECDKYNL